MKHRRPAGSKVVGFIPVEDVHDNDGTLLLATRCHCGRIDVWVPAFLVRRGRTLGCSHCR